MRFSKLQKFILAEAYKKGRRDAQRRMKSHYSITRVDESGKPVYHWEEHYFDPEVHDLYFISSREVYKGFYGIHSYKKIPKT